VPKVHNKLIKRPRKDSNIESKGQPKCALVWRTGLYGAPPDSVRCTRDSNFELLTFEISGSLSAIIRRIVRCCTKQCSVAHRTVRCASGATTTSRNRSSAEGTKCATVHARVRAAPEGAPDGLQGLSGAPPDCPVAQKTEAPTVRIQRLGDVAGASDSVRWCTRLSGAPCDNSLHQTTSLVVGAINTPNHPPFIASKFLHFLHLTRAIAFNTRHTKEIKSSPSPKIISDQIVTSERVTCVHLSSCAWIASFSHSFL
jgi:hypothetical protein